MIIRNSIKSVIRSPLKSILFFLLIMALVAALSLGSALVSMCSALLNQCERTYITIGSIEYRGGRFPDKTVSDNKAALIREQIDFNALGEKEYVKDIDDSSTAIVSLPGFNRVLIENSSSQNIIVLTARKLSRDNAMCKVVNVLYADALTEDRLINVYDTDESGKTVPFDGEEGHTYLISGFTDGNISGVIDVTLSSILNETALNAGIRQDNYYLDVTDDPYLKNTRPEYGLFVEAAEAYELINHSWYARITEEPSFLEPFVEKDYSVREGRLYTKEDAEKGIACLLPDYIADRLNVGPGDETTLLITQTGFSSITNSYWPGVKGIDTEDPREAGDGYGIRLKCTVTGIISTTAREIPLIYLSGLGDIPEGDGFCGYTLGTIYFKNGIGSAEIKEIESMLPPGAELAFYDQGFAAVSESLKRLREDALGVVLAAAIASLAMLVLFAFVFVGRQSDSVVTMYLMGTKVKSLGTYVGVSAAAVLIPGSVAGILFSAALSGILSRLIARTVSKGQSSLRLYSSSSLGIQKPLEISVSMPAWPGILCAVILTALGIAACLVFMFIALKPVSPDAYTVRKESKVRRSKPKNAKPLPLSGAAKKYILLSLKRGGVRTWAVPLVSALMAVFILVPASVLASYKAKRKELNENTRIDCYFTDYGGKQRYDLVLTDNMMTDFENSEYFDNFHFSICDPFLLSYTLTFSPDGGDPVRTEYAKSAPAGGFSRESFVTNLMNGPKIFYTDDFPSAPEFVGKTAPEIRWLEGYSHDYFSGTRRIRETFDFYSTGDVYTYRGPNTFVILRDRRDLCVVIPESVAEEYSLKLGDYIGITATEDLVKEEYKVIGIFHDVGNTGFIYTRTENAHKVINVVTKREGMPDGMEMRAKLRTTASCASFRLVDTSRILEAKKWLLNQGYSRVHTAGFYRLYPILEDQEYCEALERLERNIGYLEKVLPAMAVLVMTTGFAAAYLLMFRRKVEIATLRSIGETSGRVFAIFTAEQLLTAVIGTVIGIGLWVLIAGVVENMWLAAAFFAGFLAGTVASAWRMSRNNLLEVLSDKE